MGQLSLLLVISAFLTSGFLVYRANNAAQNAEEKVWEHQYRVLARDAASTGMNSAVRQLTQAISTNTAWTPTAVAQSNVEHNGGQFTVEAFDNQCSILTSTRRNNLMASYTGATLMEVRSTGTYSQALGANTDHRHRLTGCFVQADYSLFRPPSSQYAFISRGSFTFNGGPSVHTISGEGNVHSNGTMTLRPQVSIAGHATYSTSGGQNQSNQVSSYGVGPSVPMTPFDASVFRAANGLPAAGSPSVTTSAYRYDGGTVTVGGNSLVRIGHSPMPADNGASNPYIWFVDGDLNVDADVHLPGYTIIMATGNVTFSGRANATVTGTSPPRNASAAQVRAWVNSQLINGRPPIAWYGRDVTINGTPNVVGNFFTNGNFSLDGGGNGGNLVGSVAAYGTITANGGGSGNNFWFVGAADETIIPGLLLPGKQIVRLAFAEWTDPVLDN